MNVHPSVRKVCHERRKEGDSKHRPKDARYNLQPGSCFTVRMRADWTHAALDANDVRQPGVFAEHLPLDARRLPKD
jgi:hypothetical protein